MNSYLDNNRWKVLAGGWIVLSLLLVANYLLPELQETISMYQQWNRQQEQISSVENWQSQLEDLRGKQERLGTYFSDIYVGLPSSDQMSTIIEEIFRKGKEASIRIQRIQPSKREEFKSHTVIPIRIEAAGNYHRIGAFTQHVEQSQYLIKVRNYSLFAGEDQPSALRARLLIEVIILRENAESKLQTDA